jgi:hypothetical protein
MKVDGNGQGKILTPEELRLLFTLDLFHHAIALCLALLIHGLSSIGGAGAPDHRY